MSIVKAKLEQKNAEFISIRELLELLCKEGAGCTLQEAAKYLLGALQKPGAPSLMCQSLSHGLCKTLNGKDLLLEIARTGMYPDDIPF